MQEYYAAPMEGLTGWRWRQVHAALFGTADRYYTPFLSPNANFEFQTKELQEIAPENNRDLPVVPQILTNRAEYFIWAAKECQSRGYGEVNLNLGCPSGTVTGKIRGGPASRRRPAARAAGRHLRCVPGYENLRQDPYRLGRSRSVARSAGYSQ